MATGSRLDPAELAGRLMAGDRGALARAISLVEDGDAAGDELVATTFARTGRARTVGLTGPPGAGKSTLAGALTDRLRAGGRTVAIVSVDPSSPYTQGAVLGDRIRLERHYLDDGVYIRSMASRGASGGLAEAAFRAVLLLDAAGYDDILIETVGVGQGEVAIAGHADSVVLVVMPGSGDSVQALKAGVLEIPDVIAVNKRDHPHADATARDLRAALRLGPGDGWEVPVVLTEATSGDGADELVAALARHGEQLAADGALGRRRELALRDQVIALAAAAKRRALERRVDADPRWEAIIDDVAGRRLDPSGAARMLLDEDDG